jgi:hypothetical protein
MMLSGISTNDLEAELKKRKEAEKVLSIPAQLEKQDFGPLQEICQNYIDGLASRGYADEDYHHYIYETAMECIFGKKVWQWINKSHP